MILRYNAFTIAWGLFIMLVTLAPGKDMPYINLWEMMFDKAAHGFVFLVLTLLMVVGFSKQSTSLKLKMEPVKYALLVSILYGLLLESIQGIIPDRSFDVKDILANTAGCFSGILLFYIIYKL
jgi:VanZ family protein